MADEDSRPLLSYHEIDADISRQTLAVVEAKQYDTVRKVKVHLTDSNISWQVPDNVEMTVSFKKSDRIGGFYDETEDGQKAVVIDANERNVVYVAIDRQVLTTPGNVTVDINFYKKFTYMQRMEDSINREERETSARVTTFSFLLKVQEAALGELDLVSNPYFNVLAADIASVLSASENLTGITVADPVTRLAPNTTPTVSITGGSETEDPYVLHFGIPVSPSINKGTITTLAPGSQATASITGGATADQPYLLNLGIPQGATGDPAAPSSQLPTFRYAQTTSGTTVPSSWSTTRPAPESQKYNWTEITITWNNGGSTKFYNVSYNGLDGDGSAASQLTVANNTASPASFGGSTIQSHIEAIESMLVVDISNVSTPTTIEDERITSDHYVLEAYFGNHYAALGDWTVTTASGSPKGTLTITGSKSVVENTSLRLILVKSPAYKAVTT